MRLATGMPMPEHVGRRHSKTFGLVWHRVLKRGAQLRQIVQGGRARVLASMMISFGNADPSLLRYPRPAMDMWSSDVPLELVDFGLVGATPLRRWGHRFSGCDLDQGAVHGTGPSSA
jgi:hypothetical protein